MAKYLITGVSSGIGRVLAKKLIEKGQSVWGIARREKLLKSLKKEVNSKCFVYSSFDQKDTLGWQSLVKQLRKRRFIPTVVIFNAAISEYDLENGVNIDILEKIFEINFLGIMKGISNLLPLLKTPTQVIAISSFSSLKGSSIEGIGYASSKAALSIGFESLYQKYKGKNILFKTIYFGPINSGMGPFKKNPFILAEEQAVKFIMDAIKGNKALYYYPKSIFFIMKLIKLLPSHLYFKVLSKMESVNLKLRKNVN